MVNNCCGTSTMLGINPKNRYSCIECNTKFYHFSHYQNYKVQKTKLLILRQTYIRTYRCLFYIEV